MSPANRDLDAQYFQSNTSLLPSGPARVAEMGEVRIRRQIAQQAIAASRDLKEALVILQQVDKTGNFDGGLDHALQVWGRVNTTMEKLRVKGITFLAEFDRVDAA